MQGLIQTHPDSYTTHTHTLTEAHAHIHTQAVFNLVVVLVNCVPLGVYMHANKRTETHIHTVVICV